VGAPRQVLQRPLDELKVAALGLRFPAGTTDVRDSPAIAVCTPGCKGRRAGERLRSSADSIDNGGVPVAPAADPYVAAKDSEDSGAMRVLTAWPEFAERDRETSCAAPPAAPSCWTPATSSTTMR
jgi:UDPglucose 6-dehydrogenase